MHFNECAKLVDNEKDVDYVNSMYGTLLASESDPLQTMLDVQKKSQDSLAQKYDWVPSIDGLETCGDILSWLKQQDDAIADETRELYTSLGGMSNGDKEASAAWKWWKARHKEMSDKKFADLSPKDQLEVKFEMIDQLHFILCKFLALGMDAESIFKLYMLKNAENLRRWNNGY